MRHFQTYILRLLIESDPSLSDGELHGMLQVVIDQQSHAFKSGAALLALLRQLSAAEPGESGPNKENRRDAKHTEKNSEPNQENEP